MHWIPPECHFDFKLAKTDFSADVWAFGTTLWEIFSFGALPDPTLVSKVSWNVNRGCKYTLVL